MTKDDAKGLTIAVRAKLHDLRNELNDSDLIDAQSDDLMCNVEFISDAISHITKAINPFRELIGELKCTIKLFWVRVRCVAVP